MIERTHRCARTQAATLTWLAYYDFTSVYVANMQTCLKSLLAFVHSDANNAFSQSPQYICVHQHGDRNTDVSGMCTEIHGVASACGTGNGRHCHDYKHRLTGRRMYSLAYNCECTVSSACGNEESCVVVAIVAPLLQCRCINM